ncbi:adenylate kinase [Ranunculus cassubicifolius]
MEVTFDNKVSRISGVYAHTDYIQRRRLWSELTALNPLNIAWSIIGDFNAVMGAHEKRGREPINRASTNDFIAFTNTSGLLHMDTEGLAQIVNQGQLLSDEIIFQLLSKRLKSGEANGESGFILDGFPRTIKQAEILEQVTEVDLVINLKLREDVIIEKCLGRRICSQCGGNFNVASIDIKGESGLRMYMAPLLPPPTCESKLITRADDTENVVKERLRIYNEMSQPVEEFYRKRGKLLEFDLPGGIPESWPKLLQALHLDGHENKQSAAA